MRRNARSAPAADRKNFGGGSSPPPSVFALKFLTSFSFLPFSWLPWFYSPFHSSWKIATIRLLHPSFVEPLKSEVKKKISACCSSRRVIADRDGASDSRRQLHCNLQHEPAEQILPRVRHHSRSQALTPPSEDPKQTSVECDQDHESPSLISVR